MKVFNLSVIVNNIFNSMMLKKTKLRRGNCIVLNGRVHIHSRGGILSIGNNVTITSSDDKNPSDGSIRTHLSIYPYAELSIGANSGISNCAITAMEKVTIGENVIIGSGCMITDTDFHSINVEDRLNGDDSPKHSPIVIEDNVFIGARSIILKGVHIGKGSVIGAGSVVTKDIPEGEIWAGNPARFLKKIDS